MRNTMTFILFTLTFAWQAHGAESVRTGVQDITIREFFARLPPSAFDSTNEGMSKYAKEQLLKTDKGGCWQWKTIDEKTAELSCPKGDAVAILHIFNGTFSNILGTSIISGINSSMTFWSGAFASDSAKEIDVMDEPKLADFLGHKAPWGAPRILYSYAFNAAFEVTVEPYTWKEKFWSTHPIANTVTFVWNGVTFDKKVSPRFQSH